MEGGIERICPSQPHGSLIDLVKLRWVVHSGDYTAIGEQQTDMTPYNSHTARYASILAKYYESGGPTAYKDEAYSYEICDVREKMCF